MVDTGNWLFPHRGNELYADKPPMLMWLQAAGYRLVGNWRVAFLLPSLLAALGTLWCVVDLGKRLWTRPVGLYAGWALLFALQFTYQAKKAQIDPLVTFWITLANYGLLRHFLSTRHDPEPDWRMWTLGWFAAGLGTITKGVGVLALVMLLPAMFATVRGWRDVRAPLLSWRVLLGTDRVRRRDGVVAGTDVVGRVVELGSCVSRLRRRHPVPPDRRPLREIVGSPAAVLVPPGSDVDGVGADRAGVAVGDPGVGATPAPPRRALPAAVGVVGAGGAVLLDPRRQARRLHHAGAADDVPGAGAAAAGDPAQGVRAMARFAFGGA